MRDTRQSTQPENEVVRWIPLWAALYARESGETVPLLLYVKPLQNGGWAIVDVTNPDPKFADEFRGRTLAEAWQQYERLNRLPQGVVMAYLPKDLEVDYPEVNVFPTERQTFQVHDPDRAIWLEWISGVVSIDYVLHIMGMDRPDYVQLKFGAPCLYMGGTLYTGHSSYGRSLVPHGGLLLDAETSGDLRYIAFSLADSTGQFSVQFQDVAGISNIAVIKETISKYGAILIIGGQQVSVLHDIMNKLDAGYFRDRPGECRDLLRSLFFSAAQQGSYILIEHWTGRVNSPLPYDEAIAQALVERILEEDN